MSDAGHDAARPTYQVVRSPGSAFHYYPRPASAGSFVLPRTVLEVLRKEKKAEEEKECAPVNYLVSKILAELVEDVAVDKECGRITPQVSAMELENLLRPSRRDTQSRLLRIERLHKQHIIAPYTYRMGNKQTETTPAVPFVPNPNSIPYRLYNYLAFNKTVTDLTQSKALGTKKETVTCSICNRATMTPDNVLVQCHICKKGYHQFCYNITVAPRETWYCNDDKCQEEKKKVLEQVKMERRREREKYRHMVKRDPSLAASSTVQASSPASLETVSPAGKRDPLRSSSQRTRRIAIPQWVNEVKEFHQFVEEHFDPVRLLVSKPLLEPRHLDVETDPNTETEAEAVVDTLLYDIEYSDSWKNITVPSDPPVFISAAPYDPSCSQRIQALPVQAKAYVFRMIHYRYALEKQWIAPDTPPPQLGDTSFDYLFPPHPYSGVMGVFQDPVAPDSIAIASSYSVRSCSRGSGHGPADDEISAELLLLQRELESQNKLNNARKTQLLKTVESQQEDTSKVLVRSLERQRVIANYVEMTASTELSLSERVTESNQYRTKSTIDFDPLYSEENYVKYHKTYMHRRPSVKRKDPPKPQPKPPQPPQRKRSSFRRSTIKTENAPPVRSLSAPLETEDNPRIVSRSFLLFYDPHDPDMESVGLFHKPKVSCYCRIPHNDSFFVVRCDECCRWYHGYCVNIFARQARRLGAFVCDFCKDSEKAELVEDEVEADFLRQPFGRHHIRIRIKKQSCDLAAVSYRNKISTVMLEYYHNVPFGDRTLERIRLKMIGPPQKKSKQTASPVSKTETVSKPATSTPTQRASTPAPPKTASKAKAQPKKRKSIMEIKPALPKRPKSAPKPSPRVPSKLVPKSATQKSASKGTPKAKSKTTAKTFKSSAKATSKATPKVTANATPRATSRRIPIPKAKSPSKAKAKAETGAAPKVRRSRRGSS